MDDEPTILTFLKKVLGGEGYERVMFITGDVIGADTREFLKRAKATCVTKPFDIAKLRKEVKRVIAGAE